jgi:hypothetical protein
MQYDCCLLYAEYDDAKYTDYNEWLIFQSFYKSVFPVYNYVSLDNLHIRDFLTKIPTHKYTPRAPKPLVLRMFVFETWLSGVLNQILISLKTWLVYKAIVQTVKDLVTFIFRFSKSCSG